MNPFKWPADFQLIALGALVLVLVALLCALAVTR